MRKSNLALRLQPSLLDEARKLVEEEGVALNQLINIAVAETVRNLVWDQLIDQLATNLPSKRIANWVLRRSTLSGGAHRVRESDVAVNGAVGRVALAFSR